MATPSLPSGTATVESVYPEVAFQPQWSWTDLVIAAGFFVALFLLWFFIDWLDRRRWAVNLREDAASVEAAQVKSSRTNPARQQPAPSPPPSSDDGK